MKEGTTGVMLVNPTLPRHSKVIVECSLPDAIYQCAKFQMACMPYIFKDLHFAAFRYENGQIYLWSLDGKNVNPLPHLPLEIG